MNTSTTTTRGSSPAPTPLRSLGLRRGDVRVVAVSSMEQIIGTALSTIVGVIIPLLSILRGSSLPSGLQGVVGATALIGISVGSAAIGRLIDREGYLTWFRVCPVLIIVGSVLPLAFSNIGCLIAGLFIAGVGVGGGYTLDSAYISEILPEKWRQFMVGVAKATCALGFTLAAGLAWWIVEATERADVWPLLLLITAGLGVLTLLMRIRWKESPLWLARQGLMQQARRAAEFFVGQGVTVDAPADSDKAPAQAGWLDMFRGRNLTKVIYSGVTWACEGLGVYGFGVFLPVMVMALGIDRTEATGIHKVINSVEMTFWINMFIIPGFLLGLWLIRRMNHAVMMGAGFIGCAIGLGVLMCAYCLHLPVWVSVTGFLIFEISLHGGPHLVTFIIPSAIFGIAERGAGTGIAAMLGKVGAVLGVFVMPQLLDFGGMECVLLVSIGVMLLGAAMTFIFGKILGQFK